MQAIARRWARRAGVALLAGGLASLSYYALRFVRAGLSEKLLGDAYRLTYRLTQHQQVDSHYYAKVLVLNALHSLNSPWKWPWNWTCGRLWLGVTSDLLALDSHSN